VSYSSEVLADAPKAWYRMQEASGLIQDSSGNAMHATSQVSTPTYGQASPITTDATAKSILFGSAQNFQIPDNNLLDVGDTFTVEAWYKRTSATNATNESWIDRGTAAFKLLVTGTTDQPPGNILVATKPGTADFWTSSVGVGDTNWHYIVFTKSGSTRKWYLDAIENTGASGTDQTCATTATALFIGSSRNSDDFAKGLLTEVALYSTVLAADRIAAHYYAAGISAVGPVAYSGRKFGPF